MSTRHKSEVGVGEHEIECLVRDHLHRSTLPLRSKCGGPVTHIRVKVGFQLRWTALQDVGGHALLVVRDGLEGGHRQELLAATICGVRVEHSSWTWAGVGGGESVDAARQRDAHTHRKLTSSTSKLWSSSCSSRIKSSSPFTSLASCCSCKTHESGTGCEKARSHASEAGERPCWRQTSAAVATGRRVDERILGERGGWVGERKR